MFAPIAFLSFLQLKQLTEELQLARSERDALQSERTNDAHIPEEEQEKLRSHVASLAEERDQLQEILDGVRDEKCQLKRDLQEKEEMVSAQSEKNANVQSRLLFNFMGGVSGHLLTECACSLQSVERQAELLGAQEELKRQQQLNSDLQAQISVKETQLEQQVMPETITPSCMLCFHVFLSHGRFKLL